MSRLRTGEIIFIITFWEQIIFLCANGTQFFFL